MVVGAKREPDSERFGKIIDMTSAVEGGMDNV
jgi:hypothetical protein